MRKPRNASGNSFYERMQKIERLSMREVEQKKQTLRENVKARISPRVPDPSKSGLKF